MFLQGGCSEGAAAFCYSLVLKKRIIGSDWRNAAPFSRKNLVFFLTKRYNETKSHF